MRQITYATIATTLAFLSSAFAQTNSQSTGAVFVMTNDARANDVISYSRGSDGKLKELFRTLTGGRGSGGLVDPLASQGSLLLNPDHSLLFAVNSGSGDISTFRVSGGLLLLVGRAASGGSAPTALAQYGDILYVLNSGGSGSVVGFRMSGYGKLSPIPNSVRFLTSNSAGGSSLAFSPDGQFLVVTERLTNKFDVFPVQGDGTLGAPVVTTSPIAGLFAVVFTPAGSLLAAATGPASTPNGSLISSFNLLSDGTLSAVTPQLPTMGAATCWIEVTPDGKYAYTSNAGTGTISGFSIGAGGVLTAVGATTVATNPPGSSNIDIAISSDGKFLYSLNAGRGAIGMFAIQPDGTLTSLGVLTGLTPSSGFNGIAAY